MRCKRLKKGLMLVLAVGLLLNSKGDSRIKAADNSPNTEKYNYAKAFQLSMYFYDANKCGDDVDDGLLSWRGNCHMEDAAIPLIPEDANGNGTNLSADFIEKNMDVLDPDRNGSVDLSGGFHDAGDHVKFGLPQSYSGSTLGWGYYEFRDSYVEIGAQTHIEDILRGFNDFFLRCTFRDASGKVIAFAYQVGDGTTDHNYWGPPELQTTTRPAFFATSENCASDQCAGAAASLAINYLNFKDSDPEYAAECLDTAKALYEFAQTNRGLGYSGGFYNSSYDEDEMSWAAVWLNIATGKSSYIEDITSVDASGTYTGYMQKIIATTDSTWQNIWVHSWDTVWGGVFAKLAPITDNPEHWYFFRWNIEYWSGVQHEDVNDTTFLAASPEGYRVVNTWGSARYNTAAQLCALVYNKHKPNQEFVEWCKGQMDYILGDNPMDRCYEVGYAENSAKNPHHRAAHASDINSMLIPEVQRHILWGALCGGPDATDFHKDDITDYVYNEVAIDYNAGFVGALASLYAIYGEGQKPDPTLPINQVDDMPYYVNAKIEQENSERTQVTVKITNDTSCSPRNSSTMKARYFFDIREMIEKGQSINDLDIQVMYDQSKVIDEIAVDIKGPIVWDEDKGIYYIELDWSGISFHGTREIHIGLVPAQDPSFKVNWDPSNDWSREGLTKTEALTDNIPLYVSDELVYGKEPGESVDIPETEDIAFTSPLSGMELDTTKGDTVVDVVVENNGANKVDKIEVYANDTKIGESEGNICSTTYTAPEKGINLSNGIMEIELTARATLSNGEIVRCEPVFFTVKYPEEKKGIDTLELDVQGEGTQSSNTISRKFILRNTGSEAIDLSQVNIRYYFTREAQVSQIFYCDHAGMIINKVPWYATITDEIEGKFVSLDATVEAADTYLELSFEKLEYFLPANKTLTCEIRFVNSDWSSFDQENDYSSMGENQVVLIANGKILRGIEPK